MVKNGFVIAANNRKVKIRINRESSCGGNCAHCKGCGSDEVIIEVENSLGLNEGETVKVIMDNKKFLKDAFLGYGALVAAMIFGAAFGYGFFKSEAAAALFMTAFLAGALVLFRKAFKKKDLNIKIERLQRED